MQIGSWSVKERWTSTTGAGDYLTRMIGEIPHLKPRLGFPCLDEANVAFHRAFDQLAGDLLNLIRPDFNLAGGGAPDTDNNDSDNGDAVVVRSVGGKWKGGSVEGVMKGGRVSVE